MTDQEPKPIPGSREILPVSIALALLTLLVVRIAWITDDALITFRVIENFRVGEGLVWNVGERVQVYTHPLWMLLLLVLNQFTGELYLTSMALGLACTLGAAVILASRLAAVPRSGAAVMAIAALAFSSAFVTFATSGLENPLACLLIALFAWQYWKLEFPVRPQDRRRLFRLALLACLVALTRLDLILLVGPPLLVALCSGAKKGDIAGRLLAVLAGFVPLMLWEVFSVIYYGFPFPNSAYAKLGHGVPAGELFQQGFLYVIDSLDRDPLTVTALVAGMVLGFSRATDRGRAWPFSAGILLYLLYTFRIGGDFMSGRFFVVPLFAAMIVAVRYRRPVPIAGQAGLLAVILGLGILANHPSFSNAPPRLSELDRWKEFRQTGIADERAFWSRGTALSIMHRSKMNEMMQIPPGTDRVRKVVIYDWAGETGRGYGPATKLIDEVAITDAFLARLPAYANRDWRVGHWYRLIPDGYIETWLYGENRLEDPGLARFYDKIKPVIAGPLFSGERWQAIWDLNLGGGEDLFNRERYRNPPSGDVAETKRDVNRIHVLAMDLATTPTDLSHGNPRILKFWDRNVGIYFSEPVKAPGMIFSVEKDDKYGVQYFRGRKPLGAEQTLDPAGEHSELSNRPLPVPEAAQQEGFDFIELRMIEAKDGARLGHVTTMRSWD